MNTMKMCVVLIVNAAADLLKLWVFGVIHQGVEYKNSGVLFPRRPLVFNRLITEAATKGCYTQTSFNKTYT